MVQLIIRNGLDDIQWDWLSQDLAKSFKLKKWVLEWWYGVEIAAELPVKFNGDQATINTNLTTHKHTCCSIQASEISSQEVLQYIQMGPLCC